MTTCFQLSEDAFAALFKPLKNHLNASASFDWGCGFGTLFETYGEEFAFVRSQDPANVWTLLSGDDGDFIGNGMHFVNRLGYFVAERGIDEGLSIQVPLETVEDDLPYPLHLDFTTHLRRVVDYLWDQEQIHFDELDASMRANHLYRSIGFLREWLNTAEP